ncbi:MAG: 1-acyl-sn-glycerol-3-phosphate acyltransferase [Deltaproteobacteria bacterium]|nr:1-acyl-sn-glycerol-3-phosphate acyltransferase [Deltaproteobacteria bacterium]
MQTQAQTVSPPALSPVRTVINRFIFRAMLFTMGAIAVVMYRLIRDKNVTWAFAKAQARNLTRLCGVRVKVRGLQHLAGGPYMFTPNHQSHFDIAALLGYLPGNNRFAAKQEMFNEPILGLVLRTMGMIPIDRNNPLEAIDRLNRLNLDRFSTIIFPEGTRSRDGNLLPFKKGPFVAAIHLGIPVVPVVCKGTQAIMPKGGYLSIVPGEAELVVLEPIPTAGMTYEDRDRLRELVRSRIAAELSA